MPAQSITATLKFPLLEYCYRHYARCRPFSPALLPSHDKILITLPAISAYARRYYRPRLAIANFCPRKMVARLESDATP